jgi:hypothetical protein
MRQYILFLTLISAAFTVAAQEMPQDAPLTVMQFETTTINYGAIAAGSDGLRTFKFKNTGTNTLYIYNVFSSAHCKIVSKPSKGIAVGEEGEIKIAYDTKIKGAIVKTLTVKANIKSGIIPLSLTGTVI